MAGGHLKSSQMWQEVAGMNQKWLLVISRRLLRRPRDQRWPLEGLVQPHVTYCGAPRHPLPWRCNYPWISRKVCSHRHSFGSLPKMTLFLQVFFLFSQLANVDFRSFGVLQWAPLYCCCAFSWLIYTCDLHPSVWPDSTANWLFEATQCTAIGCILLSYTMRKNSCQCHG